MKEKKYDWIYGAAGSEYSGVDVIIVKNKTIQEMKEYLASTIETDCADHESFEDGSTTADSIEERTEYDTKEFRSLYGWANFYDFHCDYEAYPMHKVTVEE